MSKCLIGTSGWSYNHWEEVFYPPRFSSLKRLQFYKDFFSTVEVNYSFYRLPSERAILQWKEITPPDFCFSLKASRNITHRGKLEKSGFFLRMFIGRARLLGEKLGAILFQFPPTFVRDLEKLKHFCDFLPPDLAYAIEFRSETWNTEEVLEILKQFGIAYCISSAPRLPCLLQTTSHFVYIRLHGVTSWYTYFYTDRDLEWWAEQIRNFLDRGLDVYVFFNNDYRGYAVENAKRLKILLRDVLNSEVRL